MKIISFIDQSEIIKAILRHVGLWERESRPSPRTKDPSPDYCAVDQIPAYDYADPDYPIEAYL